MTLAITYLPEVEQEIAEAFDWYERRREGLGVALLAELETFLFRVSEDPALFPLVGSRTRRIVLHRFPYVVLYLVDDDNLVVLGVIQGQRDPRRWSDRVEETRPEYRQQSSQV